jgi:predicted lipoprotein with Yx(FWY)xxD motif
MTILKNKSPSLIFAVAAFAVVAIAAIACSSGSDDDQARSPSEPSPAPLGIGTTETDLGSFLIGPEGDTLYVFTRDNPNQSNCDSGCLAVWPPLLVEDGQSVQADPYASGTFGAITTPAGRQVTYNGAPLYYYAGDAKPGDTKGHLVEGVWFVARPDTASTALLGVRGSGDGGILVGPTGMSLYVFSRDSADISNCTGQCLMNFPALLVQPGMDPTAVGLATGELGVLTRADGTRQLLYNGMPIYYSAADNLPGDTKGDGVGGVWSIAKA